MFLRSILATSIGIAVYLLPAAYASIEFYNNAPGLLEVTADSINPTDEGVQYDLTITAIGEVTGGILTQYVLGVDGSRSFYRSDDFCEMIEADFPPAACNLEPGQSYPAVLLIEKNPYIGGVELVAQATDGTLIFDITLWTSDNVRD